MKDLVYYYDYNSPYAEHELGEIQKSFNQNFVLDGTKDSSKIQVFGFIEETMLPNTIIRHGATNTWWVVKHDRVQRYLNENSSFLYLHELELVGAIDLLNVRDLTDCGFNAKKYTVDQ